MHAETHIDQKIVEALHTRRLELGDAAPRFGLFLFECDEPRADSIRKTLERIPETVDEWLEEVVVMLERPSQGEPPAASALLSGRRLELRFHQPPRDSGYGAARKAAFEYAHLRGFDHAIVMRGDTTQPPEKLPELILAALDRPADVVLATRRELGAGIAHAIHAASRFAHSRAAKRPGSPLPRCF